MTDIRDLYVHFGPAVIDQVQLELNRNGDLTKLLTRLDEPVPETVEEQHNILKRVVTRYGPLFFLTVAKSDWSREQVHKMKANVKAGLDTPVPGTNRRLTSGSPPNNRSGRANTPMPRVPESRRIYPSDGRQIFQPRSPYSAPAKNGTYQQRRADDAQSTKRPQRSGPPQMINISTYKGLDRRRSGDRRRGSVDRRAKLAVVYKNNRFGGRERRKTIRREEDRDSKGEN